MDNEIKRGRGRPRLELTPDDIEKRRQKRIAYQRQWAKDNPEKIKKKSIDFNKRHPGKRCCAITAFLPLSSEPIIERICLQEGKSISEIIIETLELRFNTKLKK